MNEMDDDDRDELIQCLYDRLERWKLDGPKARVSVPLGELRAIAADLDRLHAMEDDAIQYGMERGLLT